MKFLAIFTLFLPILMLVSSSSALKAQESDAPKPPENYASAAEKPLISNINIPVNVSVVTEGFHKMYVRSRDVNNLWSETTIHTFYKAAMPVVTKIGMFSSMQAA